MVGATFHTQWTSDGGVSSSKGRNTAPAMPECCSGAGTTDTPMPCATSDTTDSQCRTSWRTFG